MDESKAEIIGRARLLLVAYRNSVYGMHAEAERELADHLIKHADFLIEQASAAPTP